MCLTAVKWNVRSTIRREAWVYGIDAFIIMAPQPTICLSICSSSWRHIFKPSTVGIGVCRLDIHCHSSLLLFDNSSAYLYCAQKTSSSVLEKLSKYLFLWRTLLNSGERYDTAFPECSHMDMTLDKREGRWHKKKPLNSVPITRKIATLSQLTPLR